MTRTCPGCGTQAIDDQSRFCNKCGTPFPDEQPKKVFVRTTPRPAAAVPPAQPPQAVPQQQPPVQQQPVYQPAPQPAPAPQPVYVPQAPQPAAAPPRPRAVPARKPVPKPPVKKDPLPFTRLLSKKSIRAVYWIGVIAILLFVYAGVSADLSKATKTTGTAADAATDSSAKEGADLLSAIPLFWVGTFIFINLLWRVVCEMSAGLWSLHDNASVGHQPGAESEALYEDDLIWAGERGSDGMAECPRCGKIVPAEDLESCDICGAKGCSACVREMGLLKKKFYCRECYQNK
jgi:hypothetical protein